MSVHFGSTDQKDNFGQHINVKEIRQHPNYISPSTDFDVSVLILGKRIDLGPKIQPIPLTTQEPKSGELAVVTGWGIMKEGTTELPDVLKKLDVPIYDRNTCNAVYGGKISQRMICAGYEKGGKDACAVS